MTYATYYGLVLAYSRRRGSTLHWRECAIIRRGYDAKENPKVVARRLSGERPGGERGGT